MKNNVAKLEVLSRDNFTEYMNQYAGLMSKRQKDAILNGFELTDRLEKYTEVAMGLRDDMLFSKRHTIIWSPPGAGKTYTANQVIEANGLTPLKIHGASTIYNFMVKLATVCYKNRGKKFTVWLDDCDSFFSKGSGDIDNLNIIKGVLDDEREQQPDGTGGVLQYNVDVTNTIIKAEQAEENNPGCGRGITADALNHFRDPDGLGVIIPQSNIQYFWTTNKNLATKKEAFATNKQGLTSQIKIDEHAVRDRVNWRKFDITDDEAWGWMASTMLSNDVFEGDPGMQGKTLDTEQLMILLQTFYNNWDNLEANSMRTVKEAGAMLCMDPDNFQDEFEQNFVG
jgi:hypothetical protein